MQPKPAESKVLWNWTNMTLYQSPTKLPFGLKATERTWQCTTMSKWKTQNKKRRKRKESQLVLGMKIYTSVTIFRQPESRTISAVGCRFAFAKWTRQCVSNCGLMCSWRVHRFERSRIVFLVLFLYCDERLVIVSSVACTATAFSEKFSQYMFPTPELWQTRLHPLWKT